MTQTQWNPEEKVKTQRIRHSLDTGTPLLKQSSTVKHVKYVYIEIDVMCLMILLLVCYLVLYFRDSCDKLAVMHHADVTK